MGTRAKRNRTLIIHPEEKEELLGQTISLQAPCSPAQIENQLIYQDLLTCIDYLPDRFIDLAILDPPYNLRKQFGTQRFAKTSPTAYQAWLESWLGKLPRCLKDTASLYLCGDWRSSTSIQLVLEKYFTVRNRITWEREKGRGAKANWKNCAEDIWFCTVSPRYFFDLQAVKVKRKVVAPYRQGNGAAKDWQPSGNGNYRLTCPSNIWTDLSVPFWSMVENTDHPTQKPEKLMAKLILASSKPGAMVFDPFFGSGTSCVVAKKLGRRFCGVEREADYCCMAVKRLALAQEAPTIQGYQDGYFWDRNSRPAKGSWTQLDSNQ